MKFAEGTRQYEMIARVRTYEYVCTDSVPNTTHDSYYTGPLARTGSTYPVTWHPCSLEHEMNKAEWTEITGHSVLGQYNRTLDGSPDMKYKDLDAWKPYCDTTVEDDGEGTINVTTRDTIWTNESESPD